MQKILTMKKVEKRSKKTERRKALDALCSRSALLLSVVCCIALIQVELRIQEHHRLISHSVSYDQMETEILRTLQPHNNNNWQATRESHLGGHLQETRGIKWRVFTIFVILHGNNPVPWWRELPNQLPNPEIDLGTRKR